MKNSRVNREATPAIHGFDGSEIMTLYLCAEAGGATAIANNQRDRGSSSALRFQAEK